MWLFQCGMIGFTDPNIRFPHKIFISNVSAYSMDHIQLTKLTPNEFVIVGESSGGNLAASLALRLRDEKCQFPQPKLTVLFCPALQALHFNTPSYVRNAEDTILSKAAMITLWTLYASGHANSAIISLLAENKHMSQDIKTENCNNYPQSKDCFSPENLLNQVDNVDIQMWVDFKAVLNDPYFAPVMAKNLTTLPPTYIVTAEYDVLHDDGLLYAKRLHEAGNDVTHVHYKSGMHLIMYFYHLFDNSNVAFYDALDHINENV